MNTHVVALSGGKDSTAMALRLRELHPERHFVYIATPTGNEPPPLWEHLDRLEKLIDAPIHKLAAKYDGTTVVGWRLWGGRDELAELIEREKMIPNFRARFCTVKLKIKPMEFWLADNAPCVHYVGLRADESGRNRWT